MSGIPQPSVTKQPSQPKIAIEDQSKQVQPPKEFTSPKKTTGHKRNITASSAKKKAASPEAVRQSDQADNDLNQSVN